MINKRYIIATIISLSFVISGIAQNLSGKIIYNVVYIGNLIDSDNQSVNSYLNASYEDIKNLEFEFLFNSSESIFKYIEEMEKGNLHIRKMALSLSGISNRLYYTNNIDNLILVEYDFMNEHYLIESTITDNDWVLTNDTKIIDGYKSYKAICIKPTLSSNGTMNERKYTVWYTPEIPVSHGPLGLSGLPGLILELNFGKINYYASKINIDLNQNLNIVKPTKGKRVLEKDYFEIASEKIINFRRNRN